MSTADIPLVPRPLCASVAARPVSAARQVRWAVVAVVATAALVLTWPGAWVGVAALLLPDLPLLVPGAWAGRGRLRPWAVPFYNATHALIGPVVLAAAGVVVGAGPLVGAGVGWLVHVSVDRACGYDLRDRSGDLRR